MLTLIYIFILLLITMGILADYQNNSPLSYRKLFLEKSGDKLLFQMSNLNTPNNDHTFLPEYKFYTQLILELIGHQKKFGLKTKVIFKTIRENLIVDIKIEKKINQEILKAIIQFVFISIITWFFIFSAQSLIEFKIDKKIYFFIGGLQVLGIMTYLFSAILIKNKLFIPLSESLTEMITFKSLYEAGVSVNQIHLYTEHLPKTFYTHQSFIRLAEYFKTSIERLDKFGQSPKEDFEYIVDNLFSEMTNKLNLFQKSLGVSKFLHLALIYLPAYFLFLAAIYKFFMEQ